MRKTHFSIALIAVLSVAIWQSAHSQSGPQASPSQNDAKDRRADRSADEKAIRTNIEHFVKAYNAGDAKAVAALFTADGKIIGKDGSETEGQKGIARVFATLFTDSPKRRIEVSVESVSFIGADLALEVGTTKEFSAPKDPPEFDRYTVLHVKRDGKWQMALARDEEGPTTSAHEQLKALAWLVGDWVDDGGSVVVRSSVRWSKDRNFLLQDFKLQMHGREAMDVSQRIGWDPVSKRIRSWVFDSEGGFGESAWARDDKGWIIRAIGVRPDGTTASATNFLMPSGPNGYVFRSTDRVVADERPAAMEVKVVRKPPQPRGGKP